jgi:hypothetical protein
LPLSSAGDGWRYWPCACSDRCVRQLCSVIVFNHFFLFCFTASDRNNRGMPFLRHSSVRCTHPCLHLSLIPLLFLSFFPLKAAPSILQYPVSLSKQADTLNWMLVAN